MNQKKKEKAKKNKKIRKALTPEQTQSLKEKNELNSRRTRVDEILFYKWDPIGFSNSNGPRDEYSGYVDTIFNMVLEGESAESLAKHLTYLSAEVISFGEDEERDKSVAELIYAVVLGLEHYPDFTVITID